jgi:hypothetical protein
LSQAEGRAAFPCVARHRQRGKTASNKIESNVDEMAKKSIEKYPPKE